MRGRLLATVTAFFAVFIAYRLYSNPVDRLLVVTTMTTDTVMKASKFEDAQVLEHVQKIQNIASTTVPSLASGKAPWAMAWIHLVVWNSWKSTYFYADRYPKGDFAQFRTYALMSIKFLVDHHDAEEAGLFPTIDAKIPGSMKKNHEQHESFLKSLEQLLEYLKNIKEENYKPSDLRSQIDATLLPVMEHLAEELDTLAPSVLLTKFSEEEIAIINADVHKAQRKNSSASESLPFLLQNLPPSSPFPPAPGFVKSVLGPWIFYWKFKNLWKYTAYPWKPTLPAL